MAHYGKARPGAPVPYADDEPLVAAAYDAKPVNLARLGDRQRGGPFDKGETGRSVWRELCKAFDKQTLAASFYGFDRVRGSGYGSGGPLSAGGSCSYSPPRPDLAWGRIALARRREDPDLRRRSSGCVSSGSASVPE